MSDREPVFIAGLDLGRPHEFTALAVLERTEESNPHDSRRLMRHYAVRHLERLPPATPYPEVFARLTEVFAAPSLRGSRLVVDHTGVGRPVLDMLRADSSFPRREKKHKKVRKVRRSRASVVGRWIK
jgi:hypothetical protein